MATYQLTINGVVTYHDCDSMVQAIAFIKSTGKGGTIKKVETNPIVAKAFAVTCGWGNKAHKWETTKAEAIAHKNVCPEHRS